MVHGNDWARGFMHGTALRHDGWAALVDDEEHGGCLIPMMMLCHEHDPDPEKRPGPISPEKREEVIVQMAAGLVERVSIFPGTSRSLRKTPHSRRNDGADVSKARRNDPCPCGSGKKYKRGCGGATVN